MGGPESDFITAAYSQCNICKAYLNKEKTLQHVFTEHAEQYEFKCQFCTYRGIKKVDLWRHQKAKHKFEQCFLACPVCQFVSTIEEKTEDSSLIRSHISCKHNYVCKYNSCRVRCQDPYELFSHYVHHFPSVTLYYNCSHCECNYMHTQYSSLYQHQRDKHDICEYTCDGTTVEIQCQLCSYETADKQLFKEHIRKTNHNMLYYCPFKECPYKSDLFWSLTQHVTDKHFNTKTSYYRCFECDDYFKLLNSLIQHLCDKHGIEDECTECQSYEENLADHIYDDHNNLFEEYFCCCCCNDEFDEKNELVDHLSTDHSIKIPLAVRAVANI